MMIKTVDTILDRLCAAFGGFVFSQGPQFIQQYTNRLAGHVSELQTQVNLLKNAAELSGKSLPEYTHKFLSSTDPDFVQQGKMIEGIITRSQELSHSLYAIEHASVFTKPFVFLSSSNYQIFKATLGSFTPGIAFTVESLLYTFVGIILGFVIYNRISWVMKRVLA